MSPADLLQALRGLGWQITDGGLYSGTHVIQVTPQGLVGGADPRLEGKAAALPAQP
jgi:gamma-glutamyltranspeptidase/glutathione hydrolase